MKKTLCLLLIPATTVILASCAKPKATAANETVASTTITDSVQAASAAPATTSLAIAKGEYNKNDRYCELSIEAEWPSGTDAVSAAIRKDLLSVMDKSLASEGNSRTFPAYKGDISSLQKAISHYGDKTYASLSEASKENHKIRVETAHDVAAENGETFEEPEVMPLSIDMEIDKEAETAKYCVFEVKHSDYTGGAHGMSVSYSITYDKATGKRFTKFLKPGAAKSMQPLVRNGLKKYFSENGEKVTDATLMSYLQVEGNVIPLPSAAPYPTSKGLAFHYGSYEIAPYAAGQPEFTVPFDKVKPYLTAEAVELLRE